MYNYQLLKIFLYIFYFTKKRDIYLRVFPHPYSHITPEWPKKGKGDYCFFFFLVIKNLILNPDPNSVKSMDPGLDSGLKTETFFGS